MVTRDDVVSAYRLILGREPENEDVVTSHVNNIPDIASLRAEFMNSAEFADINALGLVVGRHYIGAPMSIEDQADPKTLEQMFARTGAVWRSYGESEPYWSVLTVPQFKREAMGEEDVERFYATGNDSLAVIRAFFERNGAPLQNVRDVLEFGCGVGRTTFALAEAFQQVVAVDISAQHLARAQDRRAKIGRRNVKFSHLETLSGIAALKPVDLFYSAIVLQHNPPPVMAAMLTKLLEKVRVGGYALFQLPTYRRDYRFTVATYMEDNNAVMEMHVLEARRVFAILKALNYDLLEVHEDYCVGAPVFLSQTFFARRARSR